MAYYYGWKPYVPVGVRRQRAQKKLAQMRKKGLDVQPVEIEGRKIARTFWGQAWCDQMESLGDFANRLPRGRTYVRNGSVCHLAVERGRIQAIVSGSELYNVVVTIGTLPKTKWNGVKQQCSGRIGSLLELLEGRISDSVMEVVTDPDSGLFPLADEIDFDCNCPDWATMCKHVSAVLYGVGARLDRQPESLFLLRGVDHTELITASADDSIGEATARGGSRRRVDAADLADVFGIESDDAASDAETAESATSTRKTAKKKSKRKPPTKKSPTSRVRKTAKAKTPASKTVKKKAPKAKTKFAPANVKAKKKAKKGAGSSTQTSPRKKKSAATTAKHAAKKKTSTRKSATGSMAKAGRATARKMPK